MRALLRGLHAFDVADHAVGVAVGAARALLGRVLQPQFERVDVELLGQFVDHGLGGELGLRRAGRAVGGRLGLVDHHVVAVDGLVGNVVRGERAHRAGADGRAGVGAGLEGEVDLGGGQRAVPLRAHLDAHVGARGRPGREQHFLAVHRQLDGAAGLAGEDRGQRLEVDGDLAAEAAADLHRRDLHLRGREPHQRGDRVAHDERALRAGPDVERAVGAPVGGAVLRLDVTLMRHRGLELALDHDVGLLEAGVQVALGEAEVRGGVGGVVRLGAVHLAGFEVVVQQRRGVEHRVADVEDGRELLVLDFDQGDGVFRDVVVGGGDGGDGVALVEHLVGGDHVVEQPLEVGAALAGVDVLVGGAGEVGVGDHGEHAGQGTSLGGVDRLDLGVRMRAAEDAPVEHAGQGEVGPVLGRAGDFVNAVVADRAGADDLVVAGSGCHVGVPSVGRRAVDPAVGQASSAAAWTARMILS